MMEITGSTETDSKEGGARVAAWRLSAWNMMFEFSILSWKKKMKPIWGWLSDLHGWRWSVKKLLPSSLWRQSPVATWGFSTGINPTCLEERIGQNKQCAWLGRSNARGHRTNDASKQQHSGQSPPAFWSFQHIVSALHGAIFITSIYRIHFAMQNTFLFIHSSGTYISLVASKSIRAGKFLRDHFSNIWIY